MLKESLLPIKCIMLILYCHIVILKENFVLKNGMSFLEEKPSLEMHKAYLRGKINLTLRVFDIVFFLFFCWGAMHKNSAVGFLLQLHEQIIIIFAAL